MQRSETCGPLDASRRKSVRSFQFSEVLSECACAIEIMSAKRILRLSQVADFNKIPVLNVSSVCGYSEARGLPALGVCLGPWPCGCHRLGQARAGRHKQKQASAGRHTCKHSGSQLSSEFSALTPGTADVASCSKFFCENFLVELRQTSNRARQ